MELLYFPGCSLESSGKRLGKGLRRIMEMLRVRLKEVPDWNCCGASEYEERAQILALSRRNIEKARGLGDTLLAPCPACAKNLKEVAKDIEVVHPLDLPFSSYASLNIKRDLKGKVFTPFYGCLLLRPKETAIKNPYIMEEFVELLGGEVDGERVRNLCCGGAQLFREKEITRRLCERILGRSRGTILVFCPLCHMAIKTFSAGRSVAYFTDLLLYTLDEEV
jgi:heterodisulfide reductase subunit B